jgi:hypothetical protein
VSDLPPPGGYPPPPPTPGWWQASDGNWYPPHQHPQYAAAAPVGYGYAGPLPAAQGTNGLAVASLVLGIVWIYWLGSVLAVVFGHVALSQVRRTGQGGRGLAIAGLVLGYIWLTLLVIGIVGIAVEGDLE